MSKLSEMILNEMSYDRRRTSSSSTRPSRHIKNLNLGEKILVQSGHNIHLPKETAKPALTAEELKKKKEASEKRALNRQVKKEKEEELVRLRAEKEARENLAKEAEQKAKENELKEKELELKEQEKQAELKRKQEEAEAIEKEQYKEIVEKNKEREKNYTQSVSKIKDFEKIPEKEEKEEKPRSSGLLSTAARSLRF